jgi:hypothetical protein
MSQQIETDEQKRLEKEFQAGVDLMKRTHIFFKKPLKIWYYARVDGHNIVPVNDKERVRLAQIDDDLRKQGKTIDIELKSFEVKEATDLVDLKNKRIRGEIRFVPELEWQLLMELFDQAGLTTTVVDPMPEPATADA